MVRLLVVDKRLFLAVLLYIWLPRNTRAGRFVSNGPVLTITLKDPQPSFTFGSTTSTTSLTSSDPSTLAASPQQLSPPPPQQQQQQQQQSSWLNLESLRPSLLWSVQSRGQPLPQWLPGWHSLKATIGYQYDELRRMPSFVEADLKFSLPLSLSGAHYVGRLWKSDDRDEPRGWGSGSGGAGGSTGSGSRAGGTMDVQVQPSYEFASQRAVCLVQASRGATAYLMAKFSTKRDRWLQLVRGCYQINFSTPSTLSSSSLSSPSSLGMATPALSAVRITPTIDLDRGQASCLIEGTTASQRTKAVLNLEYDNPTLTVVHSLDERNTIAPEISLYDARILYQWDVALDSGRIRTRVDPTSAIHVTWTDRSLSNAGKWVTDVRIPLVGTTLSQLAADVRVRRQFSF